MEEDGLITSTNESINGRDKITYEITKAGKNKLKEWLKDTKATNDLKYETLLKVFFGGVGGKEITLNSIDYYGVKYHNLLEIIPEGKYLALNKHNPPAIINNSIKVDYNKSTDQSRIDVELDVDIEVYNPEDIIHGKINKMVEEAKARESGQAFS